jgi:hypothetical protein
MRPENRVFVFAKKSLDYFPPRRFAKIPNDMPKWAGCRMNQAQVYAIPSINAIYFAKFA